MFTRYAFKNSCKWRHVRMIDNTIQRHHIKNGNINDFEWRYKCKDKTIGPPIVEIMQGRYTVFQGDSINLECSVQANPPLTRVMWEKIEKNQKHPVKLTDSGRFSGSTVNQPSLMISNTNLSDSGDYICSASNFKGSGSSPNISLVVLESKESGNPGFLRRLLPTFYNKQNKGPEDPGVFGKSRTKDNSKQNRGSEYLEFIMKSMKFAYDCLKVIAVVTVSSYATVTALGFLTEHTVLGDVFAWTLQTLQTVVSILLAGVVKKRQQNKKNGEEQKNKQGTEQSIDSNSQGKAVDPSDPKPPNGPGNSEADASSQHSKQENPQNVQAVKSYNVLNFILSGITSGITGGIVGALTSAAISRLFQQPEEPLYRFPSHIDVHLTHVTQRLE